MPSYFHRLRPRPHRSQAQGHNWFRWHSLGKLFLLFTIAIPLLSVRCQASAATPKASPEQCVDLVSATSDHSVTIWLHGTGDSSHMKLRIRNNLTGKIELCVEVGTKLKPADASVQQMVVVEEVKITLRAKAEDEVTLQVNCLEISKDPPSESDVNWVIQDSAKTRDFIDCTNKILESAMSEANTQQEKDLVKALRPFFVQAALWHARGATRQQWIHFWVQYQGMSQNQASQIADSLGPLLRELVNACGTLGN